MAAPMNTVMQSVMNSPTATAVGFAAGFVLCFLWRKFGKKNDPFAM